MPSPINRQNFPLCLDSGPTVATLSGNVTLDEDSQQVLLYDPNGSARTITLVPAISYRSGWWYFIANTGTSGTLLISDGATIATLQPGESAWCWTEGTDWYAYGPGTVTALVGDTVSEETAGAGVTVDGALIKDGIVPSPQGFVYGLEVGYSTAAAVTIETGRCRDSTNAIDIVVSAQKTVSLAASGANGLDTGAEANSTWYYVYVIQKADGTTAGLFSTSATAPTMPAGYLYKRRVGWAYNDSGGNLLKFVAVGNGTAREIRWLGAYNKIEVLTAGTSAAFADVSLAAGVPPGVQVADVAVSADVADTEVYIIQKGSGESLQWYMNSSWVGPSYLRVVTDTSQVIQYKRNAGTGQIYIAVRGFVGTI